MSMTHSRAAARRPSPRRVPREAAIVLALALIAGGAAARAQEAAAANAGRNDGSGALEEITVTARRVSENLQDVPIALSALSAEALEQRNVGSLDNLSAFVPNFQLDTGAAVSASTFNTTAFIRGVGQNDFVVYSDSGVGLYVDGVYFARSAGAALENFEIERVEVLRGPQGTLFGKNNIGGAINVTMKKPGTEPGGYLQAATGRYDKAYVQGAIDLPVSDTLFTRLAGGYFNKDGYARRLSDGLRQGNKDNALARASVSWLATDSLTFDVALDYTNGRSNGAPISMGGVLPTGAFISLFNQLVAPNQGIVAPNGQAAFNASFATGDPLTNRSTAAVRNTLEVGGATATAEWRFAPASLRSITAYRDLDTTYNRDGDASPFAFRETRVHDTARQFSQELQLTGTALDERMSWLLGAYYFRENGSNDLELELASGTFAALEALAGPLPNGAGGRGNPRNVAFDNEVAAMHRVRNETYAAFADVSFDVTGWLTLEAGLRQNRDDKQFFPVLRRRASNIFIAPPGSRFAADFSSFTPRYAVQVKPAEDVLLYASYARGFKSGGFNGRPLTSIAEINQFEPEEVASYELGVKSEWLERRLVVNAAAFTSDYTNIQLPVVQPPANFVFNAGAGRIRGVELETNARLLGNLTFNGTAGYIHARYTELGQGVTPGQFIPITTSSRFLKTPQWSWSAGSQYDFRLAAGGRIALRADYSHKSGYFNDVPNSPQIYQRAFGLLSARVSYATPGERLTFALSGTNLTDETYLLSGNVGGAAIGQLIEQTYAVPREWELSAAYRF